MARRSSSPILSKTEAKRAARSVQERSVADLDRIGLVKRTADSIAEASCLVAVLSVPLYFSVLTATGYEPDKAILLRVFATVAGAAWLVGLILDRSRVRVTLVNTLLFRLGVLAFVAYVVATILSIDPRLSLWGSQGRQQGLWSHAAYLIFFVVAATRLRTQAHWSRLVTVLLFGSVPVVIYGFFQQFHLDPIPNGGDPTTLSWPVRSTLGQHVFLGAYLVMIIPFTAARLIENWNWRSAHVEKSDKNAAFIITGAAIFAVLTFYLFLAVGFRVGSLYVGPALFAVMPAVLGGYVLLGLLLEELPDSTGTRKARRASYAALLGVQILTLVMTGARGPWLGFYVSVPVFAFLLARRLERPRIARALLAGTAVIALFVVVLNISGGPLQPLRTVHGLSRLANLSESSGAEGSAQGRLLIWEGVKNLMTQAPSVGGTWGGAGRLVVGYGPETLHWAFEAVYPLQLRQATSQIWVWDRAHDIYLDYLVDAGLLGLLSILAALAAFFWTVLRTLRQVNTASALLSIAAASAIAGHLVEGIFGLETAVTLLMFWLVLGFAVRLPFGSDEAAIPERPRLESLGTTVWYWVALLVALGLVAMLSPTAAEHPAILSALWLLSALAAVGGVAAALLTPLVTPRRASRLSGQKQEDVMPSGPDRRSLIAPGLIVLAAALSLGSQMRFETAAFADRAGQTHLAEQDVPGGIGYLQEAVVVNGYEPVYETELGAAYLTLGSNRLDSADPFFTPSTDSAKTLDPRKATNLGKDQLFGLAEASLRSARSLSPLDPDMYNNLGNLYLQWNRSSQALAVFERAQQLALNSPKYLDQEALADLQANRIADAQRRAQAALKLDSAYWFTYYALAFIDHQRGSHAQAKKEAGLALYLKVNAYPQPPQSQVQQLQSFQRSG